MYCFHLFLISSASTRSLQFLPFIVLIYGQNAPLIFPVFMKRSLFFLLMLFSSSFMHCSLIRLSCLWVLFFGMLPLVGCNFPFSLGFLLLFLLQLFEKVSWDNPFAFLLFFFFGMALFAASCTVLWTSIHSSSGALLTSHNLLNIWVTSTAYSYGIGFQPGSPSGFPHFL